MGEGMSRWRKTGLARHLLTWFLRSYARALPSMEVESERMSCGRAKQKAKREARIASPTAGVATAPKEYQPWLGSIVGFNSRGGPAFARPYPCLEPNLRAVAFGAGYPARVDVFLDDAERAISAVEMTLPQTDERFATILRFVSQRVSMNIERQV